MHASSLRILLSLFLLISSSFSNPSGDFPHASLGASSPQEVGEGGCAAAGIDFEKDAGVACIDVQFASNGNSSGATTIRGSVVMPIGGSSPDNAKTYTGVILIPGSGGNNRWEATGATSPLLDFAVAGAQRGLVVLTYDKRSCSSGICSYRQFCVPVASSGEFKECGNDTCPGCVNLLRLTVYDFVADAIAASEFLARQPYANDSSSMTAMGHSQGCSIAPYVVQHNPRVGQIVTLSMPLSIFPKDGKAKITMPLLYWWGSIYSLQQGFQIPMLEQQLRYFEASSLPEAGRISQDKRGQINASTCIKNYTYSQVQAALDGTVSGYSNSQLQIPAYVMLLAKYVDSSTYTQLLNSLGGAALEGLGIYENTTYCPAQDINSEAGCLCTEAYLNTSTVSGLRCSKLCQRATILGAGSPTLSPVDFVKSWAEISLPAARALLYKSIVSSRQESSFPPIRILNVNGWSDAKVPEALWKELHEITEFETDSVGYGQFPYSAASLPVYTIGPKSVTTVTFANITHDMTNQADPYQMPPPYPPGSALGCAREDTAAAPRSTAVSTTGAAAAAVLVDFSGGGANRKADF
eukprot:jgi/Bigna1/84063/fgenesh1_pg.121_\